MPSTDAFRNRLIEAPGVLDPDGVHHEFVSGMHGRKLDFDAIPTDSGLFGEWADVVAEAIDRLYAGQAIGRRVLLSVANGTNRLVGPVTERLGDGTVPLLTQKVSSKAVKLDSDTAAYLAKNSVDLAITVEDVGTKGTTSATAILAARRAGVPRVEAINTWQRRPELEELMGIGAVYNSIILEELPTLRPEDCLANGYCADGWQLIEHPK